MTSQLEVCDTNVALVANGDAPQADDRCRMICVERLERIRREGQLALDNLGLILNEYVNQRPFGWPRGFGDLFFIWAVTQQANPAACRIVAVTPYLTGGNSRSFQTTRRSPDLIYPIGCSSR